MVAGQSSVSGPSVTLASVSLDDAGVYVCTATNQHSRWGPVDVVVVVVMVMMGMVVVGVVVLVVVLAVLVVISLVKVGKVVLWCWKNLLSTCHPAPSAGG